jgi:hypothetical protein
MFSRQLLGERSVFKAGGPESVGAVGVATQAPGFTPMKFWRSRMTKDDVLFGYRCEVLDLAGRTTVTHACWTFGIHRST